MDNFRQLFILLSKIDHKTYNPLKIRYATGGERLGQIGKNTKCATVN